MKVNWNQLFLFFFVLALLGFCSCSARPPSESIVPAVSVEPFKPNPGATWCWWEKKKLLIFKRS